MRVSTGLPAADVKARVASSRRGVLQTSREQPETETTAATEGVDGSGPVAFVLMAGGFSPPPLSVAAGCSVLDLHLTPEQSVLDRWQWAVSTLDRAGVTGERLCLCGGSTALPTSTVGAMRTVLDQSDYRGPAGALRDACEAFGDDTTIIAAEAARCCTIDLNRMLSTHRRTGAEVTVSRNADQSPAGIYIIAKGLLGTVPHAGFMDLKEQWISKLISQGRHVQVHELREEGALPLRSREDFIHAMLACNGGRGEVGRGLEPRLVRGTTRVASVVCEGAEVASDAVLVDSLVMAGAKIGASALLGRCIVGPECTVAPGAELVDAVVGPSGVTFDVGAEPRTGSTR